MLPLNNGVNSRLAIAGIPVLDGTLPSWLTDIERAVYEACTDKPQSTIEVVHRSGYSKSRVQDAISRLACCNPPLLLRNARGVRRFPLTTTPTNNMSAVVKLLREAIQLLEEGGA
jgi:hypothetical protein